MNKTIKNTIVILVVLVFMGIGLFVWKYQKNLSDIIVTGDNPNRSVAVAAGQNQLVKSGPFRLSGVLIGRNVASSAIALHDATTNQGSATPLVIFSGDALLGYYPLNLDITNGIMANVTGETGFRLFTTQP